MLIDDFVAHKLIWRNSVTYRDNTGIDFQILKESAQFLKKTLILERL